MSDLERDQNLRAKTNVTPKLSKTKVDLEKNHEVLEYT